MFIKVNRPWTSVNKVFGLSVEFVCPCVFATDGQPFFALKLNNFYLKKGSSTFFYGLQHKKESLSLSHTHSHEEWYCWFIVLLWRHFCLIARTIKAPVFLHLERIAGETKGLISRHFTLGEQFLKQAADGWKSSIWPKGSEGLYFVWNTNFAFRQPGDWWGKVSDESECERWRTWNRHFCEQTVRKSSSNSWSPRTTANNDKIQIILQRRPPHSNILLLFIHFNGSHFSFNALSFSRNFFTTENRKFFTNSHQWNGKMRQKNMKETSKHEDSCVCGTVRTRAFASETKLGECHQPPFLIDWSLLRTPSASNSVLVNQFHRLFNSFAFGGLGTASQVRFLCHSWWPPRGLTNGVVWSIHRSHGWILLKFSIRIFHVERLQILNLLQEGPE